MKNLQAFLIGILTILIVTATASAATWTVTKSTDSNDNICDADCSLREAVFKADSGDTVTFSSNLVGQTITLGGSEIVITKRITIDGFLNDPNVAFISGEMTSRIFLIQTGGGLDLRNAILVQGNGASSNYLNGFGGAIAADENATLRLDRVAIRGNRAEISGAIYLEAGTHHIINSSFTGNSAQSCTAVTIVGGEGYLANVTVSNNFIYEDTGGLAGAVCNSASNISIRNSTIAYNRDTGGISNFFSGTTTLGNTIVAQNTAQTGPDIRVFSGTIISVGGNLIGNLDTVPANTFNKPNDVYGVNPLLAPTNSNQGGHPVVTHPLQAGSPARNGGINANAVDSLTNQPLATDARGAGFPRIADTTVDIGAFEDQTGNSLLIVTKLADTNDLVCDTDCSLREAVHIAGLNFGADTITFAPNVFGTITLSGTAINIKNQSVNIVGYTKSNVLTVSAGNLSRHFNLTNSTVSISGLTLTGGKSRIINEIGAGAISGSDSNLSLDRVIITGNDAIAFGAIYLDGGTAQHITNTTISGNTADYCVGIGIENTTLFMANATVSGNSITNGGTGLGAVYGMDATLNIRNSTIAFNRISTGTNAGIKLNNTALNISNTIVANNIAGANPDLEVQTGSVDTFGGNLIGSVNGLLAAAFNETNDAVNVDPLLAALADNGGNVTTHSLMPNSPAINKGLNANAFDPFDNSVLTTDARGAGFSRIIGAAVDKGAFEALSPTAAGVTVSGKVISGKRGIALATVYLTDQNGLTRTSTTDSSGYYRFEDVEAGGTYIFNILSKGYTFAPQIINVSEQLDELNFVLSGRARKLL